MGPYAIAFIVQPNLSSLKKKKKKKNPRKDLLICLMLYTGWLKLFGARGDILKRVFYLLFECLLDINNFFI